MKDFIRLANKFLRLFGKGFQALPRIFLHPLACHVNFDMCRGGQNTDQHPKG
jgi:hypothetical protein